MTQKDPRKQGKRPPFDEAQQAAPGKDEEMREKADHGEHSYQGHGRLAGKVALITGGDSGIGRAVAIAFSREGADIVFSHLPEEAEDAAETRRWVEDAGKVALPVEVDLASEAGCQKLVEACIQRFGRVDILVNNAAAQRKAVEDFEELDGKTVEHTFQVNVIAMFHLVRLSLRHMSAGAVILNVASIQAYQPSSGILDYAATKGAIVTFTKGLAEALADRGIRANCVAPGPVWTPLVAQSFDQKKLQKFGENTPLGRPAQPAELAPAFVFLASDESRYVDGEILGVTGGRVLA
jgi:NAD(P)-dependent dehydrogenase (short-subunit alcohol dehydrogenase family)